MIKKLFPFVFLFFFAWLQGQESSMKYSKPVELPEGPVTLRVITYRNGKPLGHLITLNHQELAKR